MFIRISFNCTLRFSILPLCFLQICDKAQIRAEPRLARLASKGVLEVACIDVLTESEYLYSE